MYRIPGVLSAATTKPAPAVPAVRPAPGLPPGSPQPPEDGRATGPAEAIPGQAEDRERIALGLTDVVVRRLLTAGQDLQAALGLMGNHPASGKVRHAVDEMDQAIGDIRYIRGGRADDRGCAMRRTRRSAPVPPHRPRAIGSQRIGDLEHLRDRRDARRRCRRGAIQCVQRAPQRTDPARLRTAPCSPPGRPPWRWQAGEGARRPAPRPGPAEGNRCQPSPPGACPWWPR